MSECGKYLGALALASFYDVAVDADLSLETPKPFGFSNSKSLTAGITEVDSTDDATGSVAGAIATGQTLETTVSGFARDDDAASNGNSLYLKNWYHTKLNAGEQPKLWVEYETPGETILVWCLMTGYSMSGGSKELQTLEATFKAVDTCDATIDAIQYTTPPAA